MDDAEGLFAGEEWTCPVCKHSPDVEGNFLRFAPELALHNCDYDPKHFDLLFALEDNSFWFQARNHLIVWALRRFFPKAERIMEIGVGTGFVMRAIRQPSRIRGCTAAIFISRGCNWQRRGWAAGWI